MIKQDEKKLALLAELSATVSASAAKCLRLGQHASFDGERSFFECLCYDVGCLVAVFSELDGREIQDEGFRITKKELRALDAK